MKASGYWFYFSGTEGYHCITGSNSRSAFPIGSMSLTHMPNLKSFSKKCCVVLTSTKISGCQQPWPFVTLKENKCNCSQATGQVCVVSLWLRRSVSASPAVVHRSAWALSIAGSLSPSRKMPSVGAVLLCPPLSLAGPRTGGRHRDSATTMPPSASLCWAERLKGASPVPAAPKPGSWGPGGAISSKAELQLNLGKTGFPLTPPHLTYLRVKR